MPIHTVFLLRYVLPINFRIYYVKGKKNSKKKIKKKRKTDFLVVHICVLFFSPFKIKLYIQYIHHSNNTNIKNLYLTLSYQLQCIFEYIEK